MVRSGTSALAAEDPRLTETRTTPAGLAKQLVLHRVIGASSPLHPGQMESGRSGGLLRYWDPRLFLAVSETLTPQQGRWFHAPVSTWHWLDRDDQPSQLAGQPAHPSELPQTLPTLELSNEQVAELIAWMDAEDYRALTCAQHQEYGLPNRETLQQHFVRAYLDANQQGVVDIDQRRAHVREWLARNSSISPKVQRA